MAKQSGKAEAAPPKEGIELHEEEIKRQALKVENMIFNILMKVEAKIMEALENFEPPVSAQTGQVPAKSAKTEEERKIDEVNKKRLEDFRKAKEAEKTGVDTEELERYKRFKKMEVKNA